jgi:hypothetical protein
LRSTSLGKQEQSLTSATQAAPGIKLA